MSAPLKYGRDYASVMRKVFQVDEDNSGGIEYYDKDFYDMVDPKFISATTHTPQTPVDADRVIVDIVELPLYLKIPKSKARRIRFNVKERMKQVIKSQISAKEDTYLIGLLEIAIQSPANTNVLTTVAKANLSAVEVSKAIAEVEGTNTKVATNCVIHPSNAHFIRMFNRAGNQGFYASPKYSDEVMDNGRMLSFYGMTFLFTTMCPKDRMYITAEPEYTGRVVEVLPPVLSPYNDEVERTEGYVGVQEAGYLLHNVTAVAGIVLT